MGTARVSAPHLLSQTLEFRPLPDRRQGALAAGGLQGRIELMPLLPLEPYLFPDDLLNQAPEGPEAAGRWWVLHTRPRCEKALSRKLLGGKLPFFLPLYQRQWVNQGRRF